MHPAALGDPGEKKESTASLKEGEGTVFRRGNGEGKASKSVEVSFQKSSIGSKVTRKYEEEKSPCIEKRSKTKK